MCRARPSVDLGSRRSHNRDDMAGTRSIAATDAGLPTASAIAIAIHVAALLLISVVPPAPTTVAPRGFVAELDEQSYTDPSGAATAARTERPSEPPTTQAAPSAVAAPIAAAHDGAQRPQLSAG